MDLGLAVPITLNHFVLTGDCRGVCFSYLDPFLVPDGVVDLDLRRGTITEGR